MLTFPIQKARSVYAGMQEVVLKINTILSFSQIIKFCQIIGVTRSLLISLAQINYHMNRNIFLYFVFILLAITGCTSLSMVNSIPEDSISDAISKHYDSKSQIRYLVSNDEENLHLNIKTNHPPTIAKILRAGLKIYFDPNGNKKKTVFLHYPMGSSKDFEQFKSQGKGPQKKPDLKNLINATSIGAEFVTANEKVSFTTLQPKKNVRLAISSNENEELVYDMIIPFSEISSYGKSGLFNLSVGIETGSFDMPAQSPVMDNDSRQGQGGRPAGGGMPQPGARTNSTSYSGGGNRSRSGGAPHDGYTELNEPSKIWFLVGIYR